MSRLTKTFSCNFEISSASLATKCRCQGQRISALRKNSRTVFRYSPLFSFGFQNRVYQVGQLDQGSFRNQMVEVIMRSPYLEFTLLIAIAILSSISYANLEVGKRYPCHFFLLTKGIVYLRSVTVHFGVFKPSPTTVTNFLLFSSFTFVFSVMIIAGSQ
jgi:hypothetical protein